MTDDSNLALRQAIARRILETPQQRISFADYMEMALYHPQHGYYSTGAGIGERGDFVTSPHLSADFGEMLAEQFAQMWEMLNRPVPFSLVELGAGQGILAADILRYLHKYHFDCFEAIAYTVVEKSAALRQQQQQQLQGASVQWCDLEEISENSITGCIFSNELFDALPIHQIAIAEGQLREVYVTLASDSDLEFKEVLGDVSTPKLTDYFDRAEIQIPSPAYPDGYRSEVNLVALDWIENLTRRLHRGYLLTVDYGHTSDRYYSPQRSRGTLQCYYCHRYHDDPYINIGRQDITAHVDFTALQRQGEACGAPTVGLTQQGLFLMALGLGDRIAALSATDNPDSQATATGRDIATVLNRRQTLHSLIDPLGMGKFKVLIQAKGSDAVKRGRSLQGLQAPTLRR